MRAAWKCRVRTDDLRVLNVIALEFSLTRILKFPETLKFFGKFSRKDGTNKKY